MKKTDTRKKAVALRYDQSSDSAPKIVAKGEEHVATKIIKLARESGVPIKEDKDLVEMLSQIELNAEIPPKLFKAVAEIFIWLYRMTDR